MQPTATIQAVIEGRLSRSKAPNWTRAGIAMAVYRHACDVLSELTRDGRRDALERVPESIREDVEAEAKRLWELRRKPS